MAGEKRKLSRYPVPDAVRGLVLINAAAYHLIWDLVYIFGMDWAWYRSRGAYVWQQWICWTFIFLSGFCWSMGRRRLRRGTMVFAAGLAVTVVTFLFMPESRVLFGVLTLIGSCMLIWILAEKLFRHVPAVCGMICSILLFFLTRNVNRGSLGFEGWKLGELPRSWYANEFTAYLGFPHEKFFSTDYFSLVPWIFLFGGGYFFWRILKEKNGLKALYKVSVPPLEFLGRHSLPVYLLHQPAIFVLLQRIFS